MNDFHVNVGHFFAQSYESEYSMLRRCLVVNPGIHPSMIENDLRKGVPELGSPASRLRSLQLKPSHIHSRYGFLENSYRRQCPECAKRLYHTDIFVLPWLTRCPLHHCKLTEICPHCLQPWPDKKSLHKTECRVCGRAALSDLIIHKKEVDIKPISDIYDLIEPVGVIHNLDDNYDHRIFSAEYSFPWWNKTDITSSLFPASQAYHKPYFTKKKLKELHVHYRPIYCQSSSIHPVKMDNMIKKYRSLTKEYVVPKGLIKTCRRQWRDDYIVMNKILSWIKNKVPGHQIHITNYRNTDTSYFIKTPNPCVYCMALSIWFFYIASLKYGEHAKNVINHYPFWLEGGLPPFFRINDPYIITYNRDDKSYLMNKSFNRWFYCRGLELLFVEIFNCLSEWNVIINKIRNNQYSKNERPARLAVVIGRDCHTYLINDRFYYFYTHENVLDSAMTNPDQEDVFGCDNYHENSTQNDWSCHVYNLKNSENEFYSSSPKNKFDVTLPKSKLDFSEYLLLHNKFDDVFGKNNINNLINFQVFHHQLNTTSAVKLQ